MLQTFKNITGLLGNVPSKHPLVRIAPLRADFLAYFDDLAFRANEALESLRATEEQRRTLRNKLCDANGFFAAVTEVETLVHLHDAHFAITIEPLYPSRGPDFQVEKDGLRCFVEDRSIGPEEHEIGLDLKFDYLHKKLDRVQSRYALHFNIPDRYVAYSPELKRAVRTALKVLNEIESGGRKEAALYYFSQGDYIVLDKNLHFSGFDPNASEEELETQNRCLQPGTLCVDYQIASNEPIGGMFALGDEARWLQPQSRVRSALSSKIDQMIKGERNVIVLDISHANVTEREVADSIYGSVGIEIGVNPATGGAEILGQKRKDDGFFRNTTRVQAVVSVRRVITNNTLATVWTVFPTSNDNAQARLSLAELQEFGGLLPGSESLASGGS